MDIPVSTKAALLEALITGEAYGGLLIERVSKRTRGVMDLKEGSVYPALAALERDRFIKRVGKDEVVPGRGGRPRRYFVLAAKGKKAAIENRKVIWNLFLQA